MVEQQLARVCDHRRRSSTEAKKVEQNSIRCDNLGASPIPELDRKDLLIVKDGTIRVAESLDCEQQDYGTNGRKRVTASGTWTKDEHDRFLRAMTKFPKGPWKVIAEMVATRTVRQTQTHAQKYREKIARRLRGLRNRNGTLQTPRLSFQPPYTSAHTRVYQHAPHDGYVTPSVAHLVAAPMRVLPSAQTSFLPTLPRSRSSFATTYPSTPHSALFDMASSTLSPQSTSLSSKAFLGQASCPPMWKANPVAAIPDFDESMDFLMNVYSTSPRQMNTMPSQEGLIVTPTACNARTPLTPTPMMMKRHPGSKYLQQPQPQDAKHLRRINNSFDMDRGL